MASEDIRHVPCIERKPDIPESAQTPDRDIVADWIEENAVDEWLNWSFKDVGDETGYSRQHVANTVKNYFEPAPPDDGRKSNGSSPPVTVGSVDQLDESQMPDWVIQKVKDAYREGMQDGIDEGIKIGKKLG